MRTQTAAQRTALNNFEVPLLLTTDGRAFAFVLGRTVTGTGFDWPRGIYEVLLYAVGPDDGAWTVVPVCAGDDKTEKPPAGGGGRAGERAGSRG